MTKSKPKQNTTTDKGISPHIRELIDNGTPTDKALTLILGWTDRTSLKKDTAISGEECDALAGSLTDLECYVYYLYYSIYRTFVSISSRLGLAQALFEKSANEVIGKYNTIEAKEKLLKDLWGVLTQTKEEDDLEAKLFLNDDEKNKVIVTYDGKFGGREVFAITNPDWFDDIEKTIESVKNDYITFKEIVVAIEAFIRKCKRRYIKYDINPALVLPPAFKNVITEAKRDYVKDRAPALSKKELNKKIKQGKPVSDEERKRAIFPYYDELTTSKEGVEYWKDLLDVTLEDIFSTDRDNARK